MIMLGLRSAAVSLTLLRLLQGSHACWHPTCMWQLLHLMRSCGSFMKQGKLLCCALCCAVLCCAVLCCAGLGCAVLCCALCCACEHI